MNAEDLSHLTAEPIGVLGMSFYFDPLTAERARELGLNVYQFYGLGRAGVMGNVDTEVVQRAFTFFHPAAIEMIYTNAREKADPAETANHYIEAAYAFADRTFGSVPIKVLADFAAAAQIVATHVTTERHLLFDGYRLFPFPADPVRAAYQATIELRELRGGAHIDAVHQVGLTAAEACYLQDASLFALHGYAEADAPAVTDEMRAQKIEAEELTAAFMAQSFEVLNASQRQQLADGTVAMFDALSAPTPVAR